MSEVMSKDKHRKEKNILKKSFWSQILQSSIRSSFLSFGKVPRGHYGGFPPSLGMAWESQRVERGPMSEHGPHTVRKPSQDLHNFKVSGYKISSGAWCTHETDLWVAAQRIILSAQLLCMTRYSFGLPVLPATHRVKWLFCSIRAFVLLPTEQ